MQKYPSNPKQQLLKRKPIPPSDSAHSTDLLDTLHQNESLLSTPEEERMKNLLKRTKEEGSG